MRVVYNVSIKGVQEGVSEREKEGWYEPSDWERVLHRGHVAAQPWEE